MYQMKAKMLDLTKFQVNFKRNFKTFKTLLV
jgi:hypothetical protein